MCFLFSNFCCDFLGGQLRLYPPTLHQASAQVALLWSHRNREDSRPPWSYPALKIVGSWSLNPYFVAAGNRWKMSTIVRNYHDFFIRIHLAEEFVKQFFLLDKVLDEMDGFVSLSYCCFKSELAPVHSTAQGPLTCSRTSWDYPRSPTLLQSFGVGGVCQKCWLR